MIKITAILLVLTVALALVHGALAEETPNATITPTPAIISQVFNFGEEVVKGVQREGFTIMQMVKTSEYTASAIAVKPEIKMHKHPDGNHVIYIVNGSGTGILDGRSYALKPGTIVHIPKGSTHNIKADGGEMQILDFAYPPFDPAKIEWIAPNATITPTPTAASAVFGFSEEVMKGVQREGFTIMQMVKTPEYTASAIAVKPEIKMHRHPDGNHVIYIVNGSGVGILDGKSYALKPGTIVHIPEGSTHNIKAEGGEMQILDFARPPFDPAKIEWITPTVTTTPGITQTPPKAIPAFSSPVVPITVVIGLILLLRYKRRDR